MTAGQEALREAARLEAARVYGGIVPEHHNARRSLLADRAEAELTAALARTRPALEPVPDEPDDDPDLIAAIRAGMTTAEIVELFCVDTATVRAARRKAVA